MSLYCTDVSRLWKYSSQSKHGCTNNRLPGDPQGAQQCRGGMPSEHSLWQQPLMGITLCYVQGCSTLLLQISPWNHSLIMEIKPERIYLPARHWSRLNICFPGCHRVSGEPTCHLFCSWVESDCREVGVEGLFPRCLPDSSARVWWHISLQLRLSVHRQGAGKPYSRNDWWVARSRILSGMFPGKVFFRLFCNCVN